MCICNITFTPWILVDHEESQFLVFFPSQEFKRKREQKVAPIETNGVKGSSESLSDPAKLLTDTTTL